MDEGLTDDKKIAAPDECIAELLANGEISQAVVELDRLSPTDQAEAITELNPDEAAKLVEHVVDISAVEILEHIPPHLAAGILGEVASDHRADLIAELPTKTAESILKQMDGVEAEDTLALLEYASDTAGGLMVKEYLRFDVNQTVQSVIEDLQENSQQYRKMDVQYSFVCEAEQLVGVLPLRELLLSPRESTLQDVMIKSPLCVTDNTHIHDLESVFENHSFVGVPVVNQSGYLIGVVHRLAVENARSQRDRSDFLKSQGIVGGEEVRSLPLWDRSRRRLSWLSVNILLNILAASVIAAYQDTLQAVIALAVFLPIISDMSGCSGNQAVAVSMRELSLNLIGPTEFIRVWFKEISVGMLNGVVLGSLIATAALLWKGDLLLGLVVGMALCINTMIAVSFGGMVPLVLKRFGVDPAIASGPLLTTITDMCGFFLVLGLASLLLV